jgi:plasmid stabilization system protein ParE
LEDIRNYIARDSEHYASRVVERLLEAVGQLDRFPRRGRVVPEVAAASIRELLFGSYRIVYRIERSRVLVVAVIHGARDWNRVDLDPWEVT